MGQEFFINSETLETKVRQLLPSQGGAGAGFDLSASTQIIPIIDLTESAEGSNVRADLQTAFSFKTWTRVNTSNGTDTIANSPGYYKLNCVFNCTYLATGTVEAFLLINDGTTDKYGFGTILGSVDNTNICIEHKGVYYLEAGDSLKAFSNNTSSRIEGQIRQIADIDGNLISP